MIGSIKILVVNRYRTVCLQSCFWVGGTERPHTAESFSLGGLSDQINGGWTE